MTLANARTKLAGFGKARLVRLSGSDTVVKEAENSGWSGEIVKVAAVSDPDARDSPVPRRWWAAGTQSQRSEARLGRRSRGEHQGLVLVERLRLDRPRH